jgi:hypothetical protein
VIDISLWPYQRSRSGEVTGTEIAEYERRDVRVP